MLRLQVYAQQDALVEQCSEHRSFHDRRLLTLSKIRHQSHKDSLIGDVKTLQHETKTHEPTMSLESARSYLDQICKAWSWDK
jgi:hypothetical protein